MDQPIDTLRKAYQQLNDSFQRTCVFHLGESAGFFSEYNMMLLAMLYCLTNRIRFVLYSRDANFGHAKGWTDYFEPFCTETESSLHHRFNKRPLYTPWRTIWQTAREQGHTGLLRWKLKRTVHDALARPVSKRLTHTDYDTQDIWPHLLSLRIDGHYTIPELGIDGDLAHACQRLARLTWVFNAPTREAIRHLASGLGLPESYAGCQIRGGDKYIEFDLLPAGLYMQHFGLFPALQDIFVLTDDYRIVDELRKKHPARRWHTLCQETEQGYFHQNFIHNGKEQLKQRMTRFFASMDVLTRSSLFVGTRTSNPSVFLYLYMPALCRDADGTPRLLHHSTLGLQ